jgi:peptidoglycan hydrolase-like protein with peptidoglycan-binding domain
MINHAIIQLHAVSGLMAVRYIATVIVGLVMISGVSHDAHAALQPAETENRAYTRLMPRSPLVERLQVLFSGMNIYSGEIDGRPNDELAVAVKLYQSRAGLTVDGRVSEELLAHIEFKGEAEELLARLDTVGTAQRSRARKQLQSAALTRSLLDRSRKNQIADVTRDRDICFQAPTVECLIHEAIESSKAVSRVNFRDWTYGEIAVVQAQMGQVDAARETAGRITDPRLILVTLRNISVALAKANRIDQSADSAAIIPDTWLKAEALLALAVAQLRNGGWPKARQTILEIEHLVTNPVVGQQQGFRRTSLIVDLAGQLFQEGDPVQATQLLFTERERLLKQTDKQNGSGYAAALSTLAVGFARVDQIDEARRLISHDVDIVHRRTVSVALVRAYGRAGDEKSATAIISAMEEPRYRAVLLAGLSQHIGKRNRIDEARKNLSKAEAAVLAISTNHKFAINDAWERIATGWVAIGEPDSAIKVVGKILDARIRAGVWWTIARSFDDAKALDAISANRQARKAISEVKSALDRVWLYCGRAQDMAERSEDLKASQAFSSALEITRGIRHSWTRAQALARLVRAFASLPGPSKNRIFSK